MGKRSQRRPVRYEKDQSGCMWGLISIFDFRHGRSTPKLLSDRRRGSRLAVGAGNSRNKPEILTYSNENCEVTIDKEEKTAVAADAGKPSVKKLIEEEIFSEQVTKKEIHNAEVESKQPNAEQGDNKRKNRKRTKRARKKSCDDIQNLDAGENLGSERPCHQNSEHQSTNSLESLDIDSIMEEFCRQIHQKSISCMNHDQHGEAHVQSKQGNPDFEEKLSEAIKLLINQKLTNGKYLAEDGGHPSKELMDVLHILSSDEELFLKLLQDPNSLLVKYVQDLQDAQVEKEEHFKLLAGSNFPEQEPSGLRKSEEPVNRKQHNFFRRKVKSQERTPSKGNKTSQTSNRIVILKPGPSGLRNPETESSLGSSPEPHYIVRNKGTNERVGSHFFLTEIKRKLKHAMGKEQHRISNDGISNTYPNERQNLRDSDRGFRENVGRNSPSKDHFFIERITRPPVGVKKGDKTGKLKDCEISTEHEISQYPKQRVSNIYIEAKKHLSEMLSNGDEDIDISSRQVPKTLGKILALPEYNFSPVDSPGRNWERSFVTAQMRFSASDKFRKGNENTWSPKQDNHASHLGQTTQNIETQPCISDGRINDEVQALNSNSDILDGIHDNEVEKIFCPVTQEMSYEGDVEIVKAIEIVVEEESNVLDAISGPSTSSSTTTRDDQSGVVSEVCNGKTYLECSEQDSYEENRLPSSPFASPSNSSIIRKVEDQESAIDIPERASPVSVLEPLFTEDDISPASTRSQSAQIPMQPQQILFEEHDSLATDQGIHTKTCMEDKESIFEYVKALLQACGLNWDELYLKLHSSDQLLDPSFFDEVVFFPNQLCHDQKLLFDCVNEVLTEVCGHYFGCSPWVSFVKPNVRPVPNMKNATREIWDGVCWHLLSLPPPHTLDQIVRKDMAKTGTWMDLRFDTDSIGIEMGEAILNELLEDTILSCANVSFGRSISCDSD